MNNDAYLNPKLLCYDPDACAECGTRVFPLFFVRELSLGPERMCIRCLERDEPEKYQEIPDFIKLNTEKQINKLLENKIKELEAQFVVADFSRLPLLKHLGWHKAHPGHDGIEMLAKLDKVLRKQYEANEGYPDMFGSDEVDNIINNPTSTWTPR